MAMIDLVKQYSKDIDYQRARGIFVVKICKGYVKGFLGGYGLDC